MDPLDIFGGEAYVGDPPVFGLVLVGVRWIAGGKLVLARTDLRVGFTDVDADAQTAL